ncbi:glycerol-3-phosphate dehydrogenase [Stappia sp. F7233]|uniref:Glycerol-3-phosphate dehydrogenase n=1 Tax=Stappia albiluteola TaxID=2758565 RepID=A0A839AF12_9HYPH|nr:glycerol-3-phosphate dehydrogenase [Stappia albiluteola]MBA5777159.1 glycerol-3-phosphate dehydrogenase [Stappia albiluteola]
MTAQSSSADYDLLIIGGGINGAGIARDAVGRGYSVCLAEMKDLASGTSSWSTKLIHGGLRYLEHYEFRLVREALTEREILWANAPHIIRPLRFVLPHHKGLRPRWLLRLGLFIYDHLGGRKRLPATRTLNLRTDPAGKPLKPGFVTGFEYSDCWVDDARLVALNARDAADRGAEINTRVRVVSARREDGIWKAELKNERTGELREVSARMIINAAGPWVDHVLNAALGKNKAANVRLVKGSHIVLRRLFEHDRAYIFQNADGRIIFAIPYERDFTLVGTTDEDFSGDPAGAAISQAETDYLIGAASEYFERPLKHEDIVWTYSGVRPLYDDGASKAQEATRDYVLKVEGGKAGEGAPVLNIFGGKITTYRRLALSVLEKIEAELGARKPSWTRKAPLPGGDFAVDEVPAQIEMLRQAHPFLAMRHAERLVRLYGTKWRQVLGSATREADLGRRFGSDLYEIELKYLMENEWARTAEDVLWRRTKLGLELKPEEAAELDRFMAEVLGGNVPSSAG